MRRLAASFLFCAALGGGASAQPPDLSGWWRATIRHGTESEAVYLHLLPGERPRASLSLPVTRLHESPIGPYQAAGDTLRFPGLRWSLTIADDGRALTGTLPDDIMAGGVPARFERAAPLAPPAALAGAEPAPAPLWRISLGSEIWAGLVADPAHDALFVAGDDGRVTALSTADGRTIWSVRLDAPIRATPTLRAGRLFVVTDRSLVALDARRGATAWSAGFGAQLSTRLPITDPASKWDHYSSSAIVAGDHVVVGGRDGCVHAFSAARGARRWRTCVGAMITGTPAIADGSVFFGAFDGKAYRLSLADGAERWRQDTRGPVPRDAVIAGDNVLVGSRSFDLLALGREDGRPAWSRYFWFSWVDAPPVVEGGTIFVGSSDSLRVRALAAATGRSIWSASVPGWSWGRIAPGARNLYVGTVGSESYFARRAAAFVAIDRRTGTLNWLYSMPPPGGPSPYGFAAAPAIADGRVFAADLAGTVYAFPDEPRQRRSRLQGGARRSGHGSSHA